MLQVKIFKADTYEELENKINAWLSDKDEPKAILSHEFNQMEPIAVYHWMLSRDFQLMQAQQAGTKLFRPQ